jgi:hypothetical protein
MFNLHNSSTDKEHPGVPQRPPASAHLLVSSLDRYQTTFERVTNPSTSTNWIMSKGYNLLNGYFTRLAITQIQFHWNLPTIIENVNDIFALAMDTEGTPVSITGIITEGWYTVSELAAEIENVVTNAAGYNPAWNFTCTAVNGALVLAATVDFSTNAGTTSLEDEIANKFYITAGLTQTPTVLNGGVYRLYCGPAPMTYTSFIDICSTRLTQFQRVKDATTLVNNVNSDVIARVYPCPPNVLLNNSQSGQLFAEPWVMTIDYNTPKHIRCNPDQAITNFDIQLKDEFGQIIYWSTEFPTEYQMTFLASET